MSSTFIVAMTAAMVAMGTPTSLACSACPAWPENPTEILASAELHGSEGDAGSLPDSCHHSSLVVLHQEKLPEAGFLHLVVRGRQLLLQRWQQDYEKIRSC